VAEVVDEHAADRACADHVLPDCRTERYLNLPEAGEAALGALSRIRNRAPLAKPKLPSLFVDILAVTCDNSEESKVFCSENPRP